MMTSATPLQFSEKSLDFIMYPSKIDILEGTARSSKSTSAAFKFGLRVNASDYNQFFIAGSTSTVVRRNLVDNMNVFKDMFKGYVRDGTEKEKYGNHLIFIDSKKRKKIIYIFGFRDRARWINVLGSTLGGGLIDEINTADPNFINEVFRSFATIDDYWLGATLNPDNPDKEVYSTFINRTRPLKRWMHDIPGEIIAELSAVKMKIMSDAVYWHFNFFDNPVMTQDKIDEFKEKYPPDSFYYNSKIKGIRGVVEGVIFAKYLNDGFFSLRTEAVLDTKKVLMDEIDYRVRFNQHIRYSIGIDLGNNDLKKGTILTFAGIKKGYAGVDYIDTYPCEKKETNELVLEMCNKIVEWYKKLVDRGKLEGVYIDGYGSIEVIMPTIRKKLAAMGYGSIRVELSVKFGSDGGRMARMMLMLLLIHQHKITFKDTKSVQKLYNNLRKIVYGDDGLPLDNNQEEMDYYDSSCYCITPFTKYLNNEVISFIGG